MKPIKIAQIGTGHHHAVACWGSLKKNTDCFDAIGICEPVDEYKDSTINKRCFHVSRASIGDAKLWELDELLAMDDLEAVAIEAGKEYSCKYAQMFADKGVAVFIDKPGSADFNEWEKFVTTMKNKNLPLAVGYMYRWNPLVMEALRMAESGELGDIYAVEAQMSVRHDTTLRQWLGRYKGGMMYFLGCHLIDMICRFQGFPEEVIPMNTSTGNEGLTTEDYGFAVLRYKNGVSFAKTCGSELNGFDRRQLVICGTKGTYEIRPWEIHIPGKGQITRAKLTKLDKHVQWGNGAADIESEPYDRYDPMMRYFAAQIRGEVGPMCSYDYEIELMRTLIKACGAKNCTCGEDYE